MTDYYAKLPRLLRDEFTDGRWLPIIGAGISANASTPAGEHPPKWQELGEEIREYLPRGYGADGAVDAISTFEQLHGRPALIDRVHDALLLDEAIPGDLHQAFARIQFDTVVTTNVDFLLERSWASLAWPVDPIVGEQRLTARRRARSTQLIKFHGDVHHSNELVLTEQDYDSFLARFPLLATYVASLLITRVPVMFGYSLEDPDFRAILQLLSDRLGRDRPSPWVVLAKASSAQVARYERRHVRVVVLDTRPNASHEAVLTQLFEQLAEALPRAAAARAEASEDEVLSELRLTGPDKGALAVFIGRPENQAQHRELVFPALAAQGLIPVTPDDIRNAPGLALAGLTQLLRRAAVAVVDLRGQRGPTWELDSIRSQAPGTPVVVITNDGGDIGRLADEAMTALRFVEWNDVMIAKIVDAIVQAAGVRESGWRRTRIQARLDNGDVAFAFLEAVIAVEASLRVEEVERPAPFLRVAYEHPALERREDKDRLRQAYRMRGDFLHKGIAPPEDVARELTLWLMALLDRLRPEYS